MIGLGELIGATPRSQIEPFLAGFTDSVRSAVCDISPPVRAAAAVAFDRLTNVGGSKVVSQVLEPLLQQLKNPVTSAEAMEGLQEILVVKSSVVLPLIVPLLTQSPLSSFNADALASIAKISGGPMSGVSYIP